MLSGIGRAPRALIHSLAAELRQAGARRARLGSPHPRAPAVRPAGREAPLGSLIARAERASAAHGRPLAPASVAPSPPLGCAEAGSSSRLTAWLASPPPSGISSPARRSRSRGERARARRGPTRCRPNRRHGKPGSARLSGRGCYGQPQPTARGRRRAARPHGSPRPRSARPRAPAAREPGALPLARRAPAAPRRFGRRRAHGRECRALGRAHGRLPHAVRLGCMADQHHTWRGHRTVRRWDSTYTGMPFARCTCGWEGPGRATGEDADRDAIAHYAEVHDAA